MAIRTVSVIGLGKLGCPMAACFAASGYRVIGVDADPGRLEAVRTRMLPGREPGLAELLGRTADRLTVTDDIEAAVRESEATFIIVPTPTGPDGGFVLTHVLAVCRQIGAALRRKPGFHLVILSSTVMPGATGGAVRDALEAISGRRAGADFGLCYNPEFVALGSVLRDLVRPDFVLIGESDPRAGDLLEAFYRSVCEHAPPVARMNFVNAELAKLAVNTFITMKITVGNTLARLCERLPGGDVDVVTAALGLDRRIGGPYLKGGAAYGGPCFPRDNVALAALARQLGVAAGLAEATHESNQGEIIRLAELVKRKLPAEGTVAVLGLAYKPQTDVIEASAGVLLAQALAADGVRVLAYDPAAMPAVERLSGPPVRCAQSLEACLEAADVVVVSTPWPEFLAVQPERLRRPGLRRVVIDCWRVLLREQWEPVVEYVALGLSDAARRPQDAGERAAEAAQAQAGRERDA